ncbi:MAG: hypothetical protein ABR599_07405 [Gemmatimonadota bacterium]
MRLLRPRAELVTTLLLALAVAAGAGKIRALSGANTALARQNRICTSAVEEIGESVRRFQAGAVRRGSEAREFTVLGLDGRVLTFDPRREPGPVHIVFAEPAQAGFDSVLASYRDRFGERASRTVLITASGPERVRRALRAPLRDLEIGVHGAEVFRVYGFVDGPGIAIVENGRVREKWRLPFRGDELPI